MPATRHPISALLAMAAILMTTSVQAEDVTSDLNP